MKTENFSEKNYFEPNKPPEEIVKKKTLRIRFKTEEDVREFEKRTGINLLRGKKNVIQYPRGQTLSEFFD